ncbi:hypothetical protein Q4591_10595 [Shewanella sp. 3_MG-2023]|uniref:DUF6795 domain-containing protein n=1 Tax=Shewanella sp. 3_MG-2023 TaxID=3062635 RepID=UPI0026E2F35F|nr:DUF6795 domain-containing protein [Shewanella sp. 3_MG-2023]MDO6775807.1 hypothetical protein [Shewanella sp. 3_MG-2023]
MKKRRLLSRTRFILLVCCVFTYPNLSHGVDMFGWFKKKEVFLSSEVKGVITENGKPSANLEVTRSLMYIDGKDHIDVAVTDIKGHFYFPKKTIRSSIPNRLFSEDRVSQHITIEPNGELLPLWVATHIGITEVPEFSKKLLSMACDLADKRVTFQFKNTNNEHLDHMASSICRWREDYTPILIYDGESQYIVEDGDFNKLTDRFTGKEVEL